MATDLNSVNLSGRLTKDCETRQLGSGGVVVNMRFAVTGRGKDENGNWTEQPNYFDVTYFPRSEGIVPYLVKGKGLIIKGRLQWREWTTNDGAKRQSVEVVAEDVILMSDGQGAAGARPAPAPPRQQVDDLAGPAPAPAATTDADGSGIPF